jgi:hypothetical protein
VPANSRRNTRKHRLWRWYLSQRVRVQGSLLLLLGLGLLVWAGVLSVTTAHPPSTPELVVLLLGAAIAQSLGGATLGRIGHVDGDKAKSAVRRLLQVGRTASLLRGHITSALQRGTSDALREAVIRADEGLDSISGTVTDAIKDWNDIHPEALAEELEDSRILESKV